MQSSYRKVAGLSLNYDYIHNSISMVIFIN